MAYYYDFIVMSAVYNGLSVGGEDVMNNMYVGVRGLRLSLYHYVDRVKRMLFIHVIFVIVPKTILLQILC